MHSPTRRASALTVGLAAALAGGPCVGGQGAHAQAAPATGGSANRVQASLDLGAASVAYDDFLRSGVFSAAPAVRIETTRATMVARGAYSRFASGNSAVQGSVAASAISPEVWKLRGELFGTVGSARYTDTVSATNLYTLARVHAAAPAGGGWMGVGRGFVAQRSAFFNDLVQFDVGGWARLRGVLYTATVTPTRIGTLDFTDWVAGVRWQGGRTELGGSAGLRSGRDVTDVPGADRWIESQGIYWVADRVAVVGGAGIFPFDVVQGLPGGRYASLAVRLGARRPVTSDPALRAELTLPYELERLRRGARPGDLQLSVTEDGLRRLRLTARGAGRVELMGDFTDWTPIPFQGSGDGVWTLELFISPGVHRVNLRVDGGPWLVPPGLTATRDEFGGEVGILVVP